MTLYLKAYQAYYQQNYDQCLRLLQEIKQNDNKKLDLQAQVHFQRKEYQKAYDIYQDLIDNKKDEYTNERRENVLIIIACAQIEQPGTLKTKPRDKLPEAADIVEQVQQINLRDDTIFNMFAKNKVPRKGKKTKRKSRKQRLPKAYNPDVAPDPERWLPMRDRKGAAHRQKQKRRQRPNPKGKSRGR